MKKEVVTEVSRKNQLSLHVDYQFFTSKNLRFCKDLGKKWTF